MSSTLNEEIGNLLAEQLPDVELLLVEKSGSQLRIFVDHPEGVGLDICQSVSTVLAPLTERFGLEVSSPGNDRPLVKPEHFRRFEGRRAKISLAQPVADKTKTLSGEIVEAGEEQLTIVADDGVVSLPYTAIGRANLVPAA